MTSNTVNQSDWVRSNSDRIFQREISWPSIKKMAYEVCGAEVGRLDELGQSQAWMDGGKQAYYQITNHTIYVGEQAKTKIVVLHEAAHALHPAENGERALADQWHTQTHLDTWTNLMIEYGLYTRRELRASMAPFGGEMIVWVAEIGCYSSKGIADVYANIDAAKAAYSSGDNGWTEYTDGNYHTWDNGLDWDGAVTLQEFEVR